MFSRLLFCAFWAFDGHNYFLWYFILSLTKNVAQELVWPLAAYCCSSSIFNSGSMPTAWHSRLIRSVKVAPAVLVILCSSFMPLTSATQQ